MRCYAKKNRSAFCAFLLLVVLAGLLFSHGEGIRLFPFPTSAITSQEYAEVAANARNGYQKNIHRIDSDEETDESKLPCGHNLFPGGLGDSVGLSRRDSAIEVAISACFNSRLFDSQSSSAVLKGRAPPVS